MADVLCSDLLSTVSRCPSLNRWERTSRFRFDSSGEYIRQTVRFVGCRLDSLLSMKYAKKLLNTNMICKSLL
jgi:hypothetical protein